MKFNPEIYKIRTNNIAPQKGRILIAEPFLQGRYFNRSIVFLVNHDETGTVGFVLNKEVDYPIKELLEEFPNHPNLFGLGGPVGIDSLYYIHTLGNIIPNSQHIVDNLYWGGDFETIKELVNSGAVDDSQIRMFIGYAGWEVGQLDEEIKENSWLVTDISAKMVMEPNNELWMKMVKKVGGKYIVWEHFPKNPSYN